jgi:hypothetical protein
MNSLTTSTLAALEEMLQNAKRNASQDCLPVYFEKTYIGNIGRPLIGAVEELLKKWFVSTYSDGHYTNYFKECTTRATQ